MSKLGKYNAHMKNAAAIDAKEPWASGCLQIASGIAFSEAEEAAKTGASTRAKRWQWRLAWANACSNVLNKMKETA